MTNHVPLPAGHYIEGVLPTGHYWTGVEIDGVAFYHVQGFEELGVFSAPMGSGKYLITDPPTLHRTVEQLELFQACLFAVRLSKEKANAPTT